MSKIHQLNLEENCDILSFSNLSHELRETWFCFDSSIFVRLTNFFIDQKDSKLSPDCINLVKALSLGNYNILPLCIIEAGRIYKDNNSQVSSERGIKHLHALLIAQTIDLSKTDFTKPNNYVICPKRVEFIIEQYKIDCSSLEELAERLFKSLFGQYNNELELKHLMETTYKFLSATVIANESNKSNINKIRLLYELLPSEPYFPKIVDYCTHLILLSNKEPFLKGGLGKIKTEIKNTAYDLALSELFHIHNFNEPFADLKPLNILFTCDNNQYYFANLGRPLVIRFNDCMEKLYYPDLSYLGNNKKLKNTVSEYFKVSNPEHVKDYVITKLIHELRDNLTSVSTIKLLKQIKNIDFSQFTVFKNMNCCPN